MRIEAGKHGSPSRGAKGGSGHCLVEGDSLASNPIHVRRLAGSFTAKTQRISTLLVIYEKKNVWS
jgi:hypothetical protein